MKNILIHLLCFVLLAFSFSTATAQNADSIYNNKKLMDSLYRKMLRDHYVPDTGVYVRGQSIKRKISRDSLGHNKDSLFRVRRELFDTAHRKMNITRKNMDLHKDSLFRIQRELFDTAHRKMNITRKNMDLHKDSVYKK